MASSLLHTAGQAVTGRWRGDAAAVTTDPTAIRDAVHDAGRPVCLVRTADGPGLAEGGAIGFDGDEGLPLAGYAAPCPPEQLGDAAFRADHQLKYAYVTGAMANGIGSADIVEAMSRAGMLGFFGSAGLAPDIVEQNVVRLKQNLGDAPWGVNFIHSPADPTVEKAIVELYIKHGVRLVEASAFLDLTANIARYRVHGIHRGASGNVVAPNRVIAKVSRVEVATKFMSPPPEKILHELVAAGHITAEQADLAAHIPMAADIIAEADSGGHTDNRPAMALLPTMLALRDAMQAQHNYAAPLRVGAAGGISTPASAVAALAMGAAFIVTGSVNQACVESGSSDAVRKMLAEAQQADVIMAPAADMFEMGVKVQVLKRGTMFAMRAARLYEIYRSCDSLDAIPAADRAALEKQYFRAPLDQVWQETENFFRQRDPAQVDKANRDPKHKLALVLRSYLGQSSRWANSGEPTRQIDYQVWCGPAMGAFNQWVAGSFLARPENRRVRTVAMNIMRGASVLTRVNMLRAQGATLPAGIDVIELREDLERPTE